MLSERKATHWIGAAAFVVITFLIAARITNGIDLSDEAYYAIFVDDWLKGGIATSTLITLHQTAALLVYPATLAYSALNGSSDGLFLFLRVLFLIGTVVSAAIWILFLLRFSHRIVAWAGGALVLAFIPFGLPAPSYNTLGLQALTCALAFFGCAALAVPRSRRQLWWPLGLSFRLGGRNSGLPALGHSPCGSMCLGIAPQKAFLDDGSIRLWQVLQCSLLGPSLWLRCHFSGCMTVRPTIPLSMMQAVLTEK